MSMAPKLQMPRQTRSKAAASQKGVTLIVGLIMLMMITMLVVGAFTLSSTNLKSVGNMQVREEAIAAANHAIERLISSPFTKALGTQSFTVDIDKNGVNDYTVDIAVPRCVRAAEASFAASSGTGSPGTGSSDAGSTSPGPSSQGSGLEDPGASSASTIWNTDWDIKATVTDVASGSSITVLQGVRVQLDQADKESACP
jgi:Tfp pilus assembly protein PilV